MPVVRTSANKVQRYFANLVGGGFTIGPLAPPPFNPNTQVWLIDPPIFDLSATKVLVCDPPVAPVAGGAAPQYYFVPPASLHMAWLAGQGAAGGSLLTGMKYGAYKSLEGTEMSRPNAQYNPGEQAPRANPNLNVLVPGAAPVCLYCGNSWGDHKINETDEVHNLALQIGGPLPAGLNLGANRMIGVLKVILHGGAPHYFCAVSGGGAGQAALDGALAAGLAAAPGMNHIHVALSLPAGFALRDFGGAVIANWAAVVNNAAAVQEARNAIDTPDDLTCAAPKLLQRAFEHFSVPANQLVGATMYLSEVSFLAATHAKYSPQHSAASCNKCRLSCWRFLCGYTNNHKKAQNPRPVGHQSMTALVGAARLL